MKDVLRSWKNVDQFSKVFDVHLQRSGTEDWMQTLASRSG
jgi:hypothetical protein